MHYGKCTSSNCTETYFWEYLPIDEYFPCKDRSSCVDETLYPVDFWLYDHRTTSTFTSDEFAVDFPDKAIVAGQYAYWPIGGRIISYRHAAEILNNVGPLLGSAVALHPATPCTEGVDVSSVEHKTVGLDGGEYACFAPEFHEESYSCACQIPGDVRTYTDDLGTVHEWCVGEKATIVTFAHMAVALYHLGMFGKGYV